MRFIDFISFNDHKFSEHKEFQKLMEKYLMSHTMRPYTEAILRNAKLNQFFKEQLKPLIFAYWEKLESEPLFSSSKQSIAAFDNQLPNNQPNEQVKELFSEALNDTILQLSHTPEPIAISSKITTLVVEYGKKSLLEEHAIATNVAFDRYKKGEFVNFDDYLKIYFVGSDYNRIYLPSNHREKLTITIQQFISYFNFVISIVQPFTRLSLDSENKYQALNLCEFCGFLETQIEKYQHELNFLTEELETIEAKIYQYQQYYEKHSHEQPPVGHDEETCVSTVTYEGIVASWKMLMQTEELKRHYKVKEIEYLKKLHFMSDDNGNLNLDNIHIKKFFEYLHYWQQNVPNMFKRRPDITSLNEFKPENSKKTEVLYRNISEGEYDSISTLKQFSQKKREPGVKEPVSAEREKWLFEADGDPGHSAAYPYKVTIYLKPGGLILLKRIQKDDGEFAAVVRKVNERSCMGIHEDALPFFNNLVTKVEVHTTKAPIKKIKEILFSRAENDLTYILDNLQNKNNLHFLEPYQPVKTVSLIAIPDIKIAETDITQFEDFIERALTKDPFTGNPVTYQFTMLAYSYGVQMSCYAEALKRHQPMRRSNGLLQLKTVEKDYLFQEVAIQQNNWSLVSTILGKEINSKLFLGALFQHLQTIPTVRDLICAALIFDKNTGIYNGLSDKQLIIITSLWQERKTIDGEIEKLAKEVGDETMKKFCTGQVLPNDSNFIKFNELLEKTREYQSKFIDCLIKHAAFYFKFLESAEYINILLIKAYLYSENILLTVIREEENGFIIDNKIQGVPEFIYSNWKRDFILYDSVDETYKRLVLKNTKLVSTIHSINDQSSTSKASSASSYPLITTTKTGPNPPSFWDTTNSYNSETDMNISILLTKSIQKSGTNDTIIITFVETKDATDFQQALYTLGIKHPHMDAPKKVDMSTEKDVYEFSIKLSLKEYDKMMGKEGAYEEFFLQHKATNSASATATPVPK